MLSLQNSAKIARTLGRNAVKRLEARVPSVARRTFSTGPQVQSQGGGAFGKLLLATGAISAGAGAYVVGWPIAFPDTPYPIPVPEEVLQFLNLNQKPVVAEQKQKPEQPQKHHSSHNPVVENHFADPKAAAVNISTENAEEHAQHTRHEHEQQKQHELEQKAEEQPNTQNEQQPQKTEEHCEHCDPAVIEEKASQVLQELEAIIEKIVEEVVEEVVEEAKASECPHVVNEVPSVESHDQQSHETHEHAQQNQQTPEEHHEEPEKKSDGEEPIVGALIPSSVLEGYVSQEECNAKLDLLREHYTQQINSYVRNWGEQQATISSLKDKLLDARERLATLEQEYESRLSLLQDKAQQEINRIKFEATTEKLIAVQEAIREAESVCELRNSQFHENRVKQIAEIYHRVIDLKSNVLNSNFANEGERKRLELSLAVAYAILSLERNKSSIKEELTKVVQLAKNRPDVTASLGAIPKEFFQGEKVQSRGHLKERFDLLKKVARTQALIPDDGGLGWQLLAATASKFLSPVKPKLESDAPNSAEAILSRATYFVENDNLEKAVSELEQLSGYAREVSESWINDSKARVALENGLLTVLKAVDSTRD